MREPARPDVSDLALRARELFEGLQRRICSALQEIDARTAFGDDLWQRSGGGGGRTRVLVDGEVFEKAGVNTSEVFGLLPETLADTMSLKSRQFYATGISLVIHPRNPMVPTVHANYRYFEQDDGNAWFGGGSDLTPSYAFEDDIVHFHTVLRTACDAVDAGLYPRFKKWCDEYFYLKHRRETRGVGGVFFDYLKEEPEKTFALVQFLGEAFLPSYVPIVRRRMNEPYTDRERRWQLLRRGRYVEFNLVYDRGTLFGLQTSGRTESILMSLPPMARWDYQDDAPAGSREAHLLELLSHPHSWGGA